MTHTHPSPETDRPESLFDAHIDALLTHFRALGYTEGSLVQRRRIAQAFARWATCQGIGVEQFDESQIAAFIARRPGRSKDRRGRERATLRLFLRHLRARAGLAAPARSIDASPAGEIERQYLDYLRTVRGLSERSICVYEPVIHDFLRHRAVAADTSPALVITAPKVRDFLLDRIAHRSDESARLVATTLRSFLRFLFFRDLTPLDLSPCVPAFRKVRQAGVPYALSQQDVERILAKLDRSTSGGRRNYAILLLLARLGLRAGEVVSLELDDIDWRTGEILIRGKGRVLDRLPLLGEIGEALASYIQQDRGSSPSRRVFLRTLAPKQGLTGPASVGHVVRAAFKRAGIRRSSRGAAHLLRHSLASRMIRHGASIAEISQVLRHRSHETTELYAKVAFESLREVARPWPGQGGAR